jgi:hypothetical protein
MVSIVTQDATERFGAYRKDHQLSPEAQPNGLQRSGKNYQLSIINYQLSIINYQLSIINYQLNKHV